eukprot:TCONS_00033145-protein
MIFCSFHLNNLSKPKQNTGKSVRVHLKFKRTFQSIQKGHENTAEREKKKLVCCCWKNFFFEKHIIRIHTARKMEKEVCSTDKDFKRKRKLQETGEKKDQVLPSSSQEKFLRLSSNRPVRRKLCFDSFVDKNSKEQSTSKDVRVKNNTSRTATAAVTKKCSFNIELENLLNVSLEENRRRCIEKYNFDPVLEKPLDGKYKWEKL